MTTKEIQRSGGLGFGRKRIDCGMLYDTAQVVTGFIRSDRAMQCAFCACKFNAAVSFARERREGNVNGCRSQKHEIPSMKVVNANPGAYYVTLTLAHTIIWPRESCH